MQSPLVESIKRALAIAEQIQTLESELSSILEARGGGGEIPSPFKAGKRKRSKMSKAGRARIAAAQRARWARVKASESK